MHGAVLGVDWADLGARGPSHSGHHRSPGEDRAAASGDPDFIKVPVQRLISKDYAGERRRAIDIASPAQQSEQRVARARPPGL